MTPEQITELKRQLAVAEYERNLILDDIAKKDARIAELERENERLKKESLAFRDQRDAEVRENCQSIERERILSSALNMAWESIEQAPHDSTSGRYGDPECGLLKDLSRVGNGPCDCWKREALAAIDAATTGLPLPLAGPPLPTL